MSSHQVTTVISSYQQTIVNAIRNEGFDGNNTADKWSFAGAFLYSLTVITTIGNNHLHSQNMYYLPHCHEDKVDTALNVLGMLYLL